VRSAIEAFKNHWPEYLIEACCLGAFMVSACYFAAALFYPGSPLTALNATLRGVLMGLAMGSTAIAIICSPLGKRSGAHFNPAVTLTFLRLKKIAAADAAFYIVMQFIGGMCGVSFAWLTLREVLSDRSVRFVATVPGSYGTLAAFAAEAVISFLMMTMVLFTSNSRKLARFTPFLAGLLVAIFISLENPLSGMSMNPARTFASAFVGQIWNGWWIYFTAPPIGMLVASELFVWVKGLKAVRCAKLHHRNRTRCIFNCGYNEKENVIEITKEPDLFPNLVGLF
jgi:aquaporin Z